MNNKQTGNITKATPGPGRPKGSVNRTTAALKEALLRSFDEIGGTAWLVQLAKSEPGTYARLLARLVPTETAVNADVSIAAPITEIRRIIVDPQRPENP